MSLFCCPCKLPLRYQLLFALILGALGVLSYAPFNWSYLSYVSFCGLIALISTKSIKQACLIAFFWGFSYFLAGVHWVYVSIQEFGGASTLAAGLIVCLFVAYLALYPVLFALIVRALNRFAPAQSATQLCLLMPLVWFMTEWVRTHFLNGFAWLQFGYSQLDGSLQHYFPIIGIDGVNFLFTVVCGIVVYLIQQTLIRLHRNSKMPPTLVQQNYWVLIVIFLLVILCDIQLRTYQWVKQVKSTAPVVSLVQGNIHQSNKWNPLFLSQTKQTYLQEIASHQSFSRFIILPEAAIPSLEENELDYLMQLNSIAGKSGTGILVGLLTEKKGQILNSAIGISKDRPYSPDSTNRYDKQHLVPFGEYTPLAFIFEPLARYLNIPMSSMAEGEKIQKPIILNGYSLLVAICYEVVLSERYLDNFDRTVNYLVTISNDAWFGDSIAPWQHLQMAQARALEFGRPLLRATNSGVTAIIQPDGQIQKQLPQFVDDTLIAPVPIFIGQTPYSKYGKLGIHLMLAIWFILLIINFVKHNKRRVN